MPWKAKIVMELRPIKAKKAGTGEIKTERAQIKAIPAKAEVVNKSRSLPNLILFISVLLLYIEEINPKTRHKIITETRFFLGSSTEFVKIHFLIKVPAKKKT